MIILASDTSTSWGSVALRDHDGKVLSEGLERSKPHSQTLLPAIEAVLARAGLARKDVQALAVGIGPGAFTGLRVGLATFKAWASASRLPLVPVVSMDAVALPILRGGRSAIVLSDARKGEVYAAHYPSLADGSLPQRRDDIILIPHESVPEWVAACRDPHACMTGTALPFLSDKGLLADLPLQEGGTGAPDALWVLTLGATLLSLNRAVDPQQLVPYYVRPPDAAAPSPGTMVTFTTDDGNRGTGGP